MTRIRGLQLDELAPFDWVDVFGGLRGSETVFLGCGRNEVRSKV